MAVTDSGLQYFYAGARANIGVKAGRYMFEARVVEQLVAAEQSQRGKARAPMPPRPLLRMGLSLAGSGLFIGEDEGSLCFDSDGNYMHGGKASAAASQPFGRDHVVALVLNLDQGSPNANTVSLFRDGVRVSVPVPLPEALKGQTLYPTVTYRSLTVSLNFGPAPLSKLPFRCRMLQDAAEPDVVTTPSGEPKDGKHEVYFPVCIPDQGGFEWLEVFLQKKQGCLELSDRKVIEWAMKSGLRSSQDSFSWKASNDRPDVYFGVPSIDDRSTCRMIQTVAGANKRSFAMMEIKSNLIKEERKEVLKRFCLPHFKKVAVVVMGEPDPQFKERVYKAALQEKQVAADAEFRAKKAEELRKKTAEREQRKREREQRKREREQRKREREQRKAARAAKKAAEAEAKRLAAEAEAKRAAEAEAKRIAEEEAKKAAEAADVRLPGNLCLPLPPSADRDVAHGVVAFVGGPAGAQR